MKFDESEVNSIGGQKSEKLCLKSPGEIPSGDSGTNGSVTSNQQVNPVLAAADTSNSKEEEKLAIEKIMSGLYDAHQAFQEEPKELEDNTQYKNQDKDSSANMKNNMESLDSKPAVPEEPVISKEITCSTHLCSNESLEELEVSLFLYLKFGKISLLDSLIKCYAAIVYCRYQTSLNCLLLSVLC